MEEEEEDSEEESLIISLRAVRSRTGPVRRLRNNTYEQRDPEYLLRTRLYPAAEIEFVQDNNEASGDFQSLDWYSLQEDTASLVSETQQLSHTETIEIPSTSETYRTESGNLEVTTEASPNGSPRAKLEECVPNAPFLPNRPVYRDRRYRLEDIDHSTDRGRLASYYVYGWRHPFMNKRILAVTGFYYLGKEDEVICSRCGRSLRDWNEGDDPLQEHMDNFGYECFRRPDKKT